MNVVRRRFTRAATTDRPTRLGPLDVFLLGMLGIRSRKMRAALSGLGIAIGIATFVAVTGIPASSHAALEAKLTALGTNVLSVRPVPTDEDPVKFPQSAVAMVKRIGPVTLTSAIGDTHQTVQRTRIPNQGEGAGLSVYAAGAALPATLDTRIESGHYLDAVTSTFPKVVLGHTAATLLGIPDLRPGQPAPSIFIDHRWFGVVGILAPAPLATNIDASVLVGWNIARRMLGFDGHPTQLFLQCDETQLDAVTAVLAPTVYPPVPGLVEVDRPSDALAAKQVTNSNYSSLFIGLAAIALLVGRIGVANTMVIAVLERRREIGLRRSLGATRGQIRVQFLTEAVLLAGLGGLIGALLGAIGTYLYASWEGWPPVVPGWALAGGCVGAAVIGILAGLYPSIRAALLTPAQALATT